MFEEVIGNRFAKDSLQACIENGRIPPALLFVGENGIGKSFLAYKFAQNINCLEKRNCQKCASCQLFQKKIHPDFMVYKPSPHFITITQIHSINDIITRYPRFAKRRAIIIKDSHFMNIPASNALLKNLEEVTPHNIFILLTNTIQQIAPTISSRCQKVFFPSLEEHTINTLLDKVYKIDHQKYDWIIPFMKNGIKKDWLKDLENISGLYKMVLKLCIKSKFTSSLNILTVNEKYAKKYPFIFLEFISAFFRDLLYIKNTSRTDGLFYAKYFSYLEKEAFFYKEKQLFKILQSILVAENSLRYFTNKVLAFDSLFLRIRKIVQHGI